VSDPLALLGAWLPRADDPMRPLMSLATVDADGLPDVRNVLLSAFDGERITFHTDARSRKAAQLRANPRAAIAVVQPELGRQLVVRGPVAESTAEESLAAYRARVPYLQVLAWANDAETAQLPQHARRERWAAHRERLEREGAEPPVEWQGFALTPERITFWLGDPDGPSNRTEHRRGPGGWSTTHLPG
jgi:pyridoxamine 5'-phosphate oxidase